MQKKLRFLPLFSILIIAVMAATSFQSPPTEHAAPFVESSLLAADTETISVIVTAGDSQRAAQAVTTADGKVSSDLWLIDAVAATLPTQHLAALAAQPNVISIVENKGVETAGSPMDADGWVTDYRFPVPWDGSPDVQTGKRGKNWHFVYPTPIEVGADQLAQETEGLYYGPPIRGYEVTVAIVDSGVYF